MNISSYVISAAVGSVIGYITNYIAIKMLFRPRTEKRIFGVKLPFTPGLIPKERLRIAKNVGEAVGTHLLTKEQLTNNVFNDSMEIKLQNIIEKRIKSLKDSDITISDFLAYIIGETEEVHSYVQKKLTQGMLSFIEKEDVKDRLNDIVKKEVNKYLKNDLSNLKDSTTYKFLKEGIYKKAETFKSSSESNLLIMEIVKNILSSSLLKDEKIKEVLPEGTHIHIRNYIDSKEEVISKEVLKFLNEDKTRDDIGLIINKVIGSQVNPMVAMFLNAESLKDKIYSFLNSYLNERQGRKKLADTLYEIIEKLMEKSVSQFVYEIDKNTPEDVKLKLVDTVKRSVIGKDNIEIAMTSIEDSLKSYGSVKELLEEFNENIIENLYIYLTTAINSFIESEDLKDSLKDIAIYVYESAMSTKVCIFLEGMDDVKIHDFALKTGNIMIKFIKKESYVFIEQIDISNIIEENIKSFDVEFGEKLILDIASKELQAITWLGAVLGAIMGLLSPIINSFL